MFSYIHPMHVIAAVASVVDRGVPRGGAGGCSGASAATPCTTTTAEPTNLFSLLPILIIPLAKYRVMYKTGVH